MIAALRELKKSLMHHLFTYGPVPVDQTYRVEMQETEIGLLPAHWQVARLKEIGEIITGTTPSTKISKYYGGPFMFISPGDIGESMYIKRTAKYLSKEGLLVSRPLPRDSVVVCIGATIGKIGMTCFDDCTTNQQINAVLVNEKVSAHYVYFAIYFKSKDLSLLAGRAAVPIVNKSNFSKLPIPLPSLPEQREIARILQTVDRKIEVEEQRKAALEALFKTLLNDLMTAKRRLPAEFIRRFETEPGEAH